MGHPKFKTCHVSDLTTPLSGRFVVHRLALATVNLYTTYEVSMFTHYKDMKGDKNWLVYPLSTEPDIISSLGGQTVVSGYANKRETTY